MRQSRPVRPRLARARVRGRAVCRRTLSSARRGTGQASSSTSLSSSARQSCLRPGWKRSPRRRARRCRPRFSISTRLSQTEGAYRVRSARDVVVEEPIHLVVPHDFERRPPRFILARSWCTPSASSELRLIESVRRARGRGVLEQRDDRRASPTTDADRRSLQSPAREQERLPRREPPAFARGGAPTVSSHSISLGAALRSRETISARSCAWPRRRRHVERALRGRGEPARRPSHGHRPRRGPLHESRALQGRARR